MRSPRLAPPGALFLLLLATSATAQPAVPTSAPPDTFLVVDGDTLWLAEPVLVLGSRVPASLPGLVRTVEVMGTDELERLPGRSVPELLQTMPSVVTGQRQQYGVQSDLTIRGSTYEQVRVLLDGHDLDDPQTGHHLLNLPLGRHDVAALEVLPGHGSVLYGPGAFGGTVNVVTRKPARRTGGEAGFQAGGNGILGGWAALDLAADSERARGARASFERFHTDGYDYVRDDGTRVSGTNDADVWSGTLRLRQVGERDEVDVFAGYAAREFGAGGFYAPYPSWERTRTFVATGSWNRSLGGGVNLEPRVSYRRHSDHFVLFRDNPAAYTNDHLTHRVAAELRSIADLGADHSLAGVVEGIYEDLDSEGIRGGASAPALGSRLRRRAGLGAELDREGTALRYQLGARVDLRTGYEPYLTGTGAVAWMPTGAWTIRASGGNVHRVPTFTDLHYEDPANRGNPDLKPEHGWIWDAGLEWRHRPWRARATWFGRNEQDLIDWVHAAGDTTAGGVRIWRVQNVSAGTVRGVETVAGWDHPRGHQVTAGWTWLDKETGFPAGYEARYALLAPRHAVTAAGSAVLPAHLTATVSGRYLLRTGGPADFREFAVLDARLDWRHRSGWFASVVGTNLADIRYMEVPGVPMPGRLFTGTVGIWF